VKRTRIVLAGMVGMMAEIMEAIIASQPDFYIAGRIAADGDLVAAMRRHRADVLIIRRDGAGSEIEVERVFWRRPSRVLAIAEGGRQGVLFTLHAHATPLGELSADKLVEAVRSAGQA
jgi:hypothetical protein